MDRIRLTNNMLSFEGLTKAYGRHQVFSKVSASIASGCYRLAGANGSGKSTLLRLLAGIVDADAGHIWIAGHSLARQPRLAKASMSYCPDDCPVYPFMTGRDLFSLISNVKKTTVNNRTITLLDCLGLSRYLDIRFDAMSFGTQKKILIAAASIGEPLVLLADEPTNGVDAQSLPFVVDFFKESSKNSLVLFSSHDGAFCEDCSATSLFMPTPDAPHGLGR